LGRFAKHDPMMPGSADSKTQHHWVLLLAWSNDPWGPDGYPTAGSFCQAWPNDVGSFCQTWSNDAGPCCPLELGPDGSPGVGSFCQDPSLLGLAMPPDPMIMGLGAQQTPAAVSLADAGLTIGGPCYHQDPAAVGSELRARPTIVTRTHQQWALLPALTANRPKRIGSCVSIQENYNKNNNIYRKNTIIFNINTFNYNKIIIFITQIILF